MKVVLYLLNKKGFSCLDYLIKKEYSNFIEAVIVSKDLGNKEDYYIEIENLCVINNIKVLNRLEIGKASFNSEFHIAIGWRWLIKSVKNLIVFHDSILPKYRGFSPLPNMLINGEKEIGVTVLLANNKMDEGDIIFQETQQIQYPIKINEAIEVVSDLYVIVVGYVFNSILNNIKFNLSPQNHKDATYSLWRDYDDYFIDWNNDSSYIKRFVDAVGYPYEGAKTRLDDEILNIVEVEVVNDLFFETPHFGKILTLDDGKPIVVCKIGAIRINKALLEDKIYVFKSLRKKFK